MREQIIGGAVLALLVLAVYTTIILPNYHECREAGFSVRYCVSEVGR